MKILQILFPVGIGGVERIASQLLFNTDGIECYVGIDSRYIKDFIEYFNIDTKKILPLDCSSFFNCLRSTQKCISILRPDIIHTHARREMLCACFNSKNVIHVRTQHMEEHPRLPVLFFEKILLRKKVNRWVATSKNLVDVYFKSKYYIDKKKVTVIYNGAQEGKSRTNFEKQIIFCIICRLTRQKGIDILIKEISKFDDNLKSQIKIDIWGEGEELESILNLANALNLNNIFLYRGATKKPTDVVVNYDALLMPSRYEGLPLTMLECMSTGTPVATHNVGCVSEFMKNKVNGWIIDDQYTWKDFFEDMLSNENYKSICYEAKKTYNNFFSLNNMKEKYFELYWNSITDKGFDN